MARLFRADRHTDFLAAVEMGRKRPEEVPIGNEAGYRFLQLDEKKRRLPLARENSLTDRKERREARIGVTIHLALFPYHTGPSGGFPRAKPGRGKTPEQRPATFDGRRRTGEEQQTASGWELIYLIDAGVLDTANRGDQADADQCACRIARNSRRGAEKQKKREQKGDGKKDGEEERRRYGKRVREKEKEETGHSTNSSVV
ncbi:hypothetical protein PUN28_003098 [Cardiocondyla obscurior]|uniref:Uncharacterized protein n=1 Tax=Cardiocondyla obscurior TaxID=286306 RepID=A0AAW2GK01_9HYME